ncbi:MAG: dephospho-CoA kinase [Hyphomicrobiaceae bacterium]|jgi:dephospho-CoA kinase|nr:dephospho-CoA kinase [Methyloceanibacter sp.]MDX2316877.1 dephospho-CoA kinase [Hyphomicrobiaceae bacterium]MDX2448891.1 dephospho-CoA kinase [Hyphomicrobiaceae bacterium]
MLVIGLTGGIGMGKTSAAAHLRRLGMKVFDADAYVHRLYEGDAVEAVEAAFPGTTRDGQVDRALLAAEVAGKPERLRQLEAIIHPMVIAAEIDFLREQELQNARFAVLEIPLLFETGAESRTDVNIALSASEDVQRTRVLARSGMTEKKFETLKDRQLSDAERRARANYVVDSGTTLEHMQEQLDTLIETLQTREGGVMERLRLQQT